MELEAILGRRYAVVDGDGGPVLDGLGLAPGASVLDVGTGSGNWAVYLAARGYAVTTGEPADDTTMYARRDWEALAEQAGVREQIRFEAFDAGAMPFADGAFAAVFFFGVLHHIDEGKREAVLREALRVAERTVFFEPRGEMLTVVREEDPGHPEAADPTLYLDGAAVRVDRMAGRFMDAYVLERGTISAGVRA